MHDITTVTAALHLHNERFRQRGPGTVLAAGNGVGSLQGNRGQIGYYRQQCNS